MIMRMFKKFTQVLRFSKRRKFVLTSFLLFLGFIAITFLEGVNRFLGIGLLSLLTVILFYWSLVEGLGRNAVLLVLILPMLFTLGVGLFWFLLPTSIFSMLPVLILYGVGIYALCLTVNIYTVSAIRTIALVRAAKSVGFVLILFTSFLLFDAILSTRLNVFITALLVFAASFPLFLHGLWVARLTMEFERNVLVYSLVFSYLVAAVSLVLYFWPVTVVVSSLFLTVMIYVLLGLGQARLEGRLFRQTAREYLSVGILVLFAMIFAAHWRG
jgi:hypothetical protein